MGIVGCGQFAFSQVVPHLMRLAGPVIKAVQGTDPERARRLARYARADYHCQDVEHLLGDPAINLLMVVTRHRLHTPYAVKALLAGKCVHLEKPLFVDRGQARELLAASRQHPGRVNTGFNRVNSRLYGLVKQRLQARQGSLDGLWRVEFPAPGPTNWSRQPSEGNHLFNNLVHWIDFSAQLLADLGLNLNEVVYQRKSQDLHDLHLACADGSRFRILFAYRAFPVGLRETLHLARGGLTIRLDNFRFLSLWDDGAAESHYYSKRLMGAKATMAKAISLMETGQAPEFQYRLENSLRALGQAADAMGLGPVGEP